jgi:hypothetical protein
MREAPTILRSGLASYLFIYLVHEAESSAGRFCTVITYGRTLEAAERVAINRVHQQGLHIIRTDTATAAPWLDAASDAEYLQELGRFGSALKLDGAVVGAAGLAPATAA